MSEHEAHGTEAETLAHAVCKTKGRKSKKEQTVETKAETYKKVLPGFSTNIV